MSEPRTREARLPAGSELELQGSPGQPGTPWRGVVAAGVMETEGQSRTCRLTSWQTQAQVKESGFPEDCANPLHPCHPALLAWGPGVGGWVGGLGGQPTSVTNLALSPLLASRLSPWAFTQLWSSLPSGHLCT